MIKRNIDIDVNLITSSFYYDNSNGTLRWKVKPMVSIEPGYIAGRKHQNGHIEVAIRGKSYMAHHIVWFLNYGNWPDKTIIHLNRNKSDNRLCNLEMK